MSSRKYYEDVARRAAARYGVPERYYLSLIGSESSWNPMASVKSTGAYGLAQFLPSTARSLGVDVFDAQSSLEGGARYLRHRYDLLSGVPFESEDERWMTAIGGYKGKAGTNRAKADYARKALKSWLPIYSSDTSTVDNEGGIRVPIEKKLSDERLGYGDTVTNKGISGVDSSELPLPPNTENVNYTNPEENSLIPWEKISLISIGIILIFGGLIITAGENVKSVTTG